MTKKVLIFSLSYYPRFYGGAEIAVKEITDRISDIEFHMVTLALMPGLSREETIGNVIVHRIGFGSTGRLNKLFFQFAAPFKAFMLHRSHRFDCMWTIMAHSSGVPAALFKSFYPNIPYVLTLQEGDPPEAIERQMLPLWPLFSRAFTKADIVQAISTFLGEWARRRGFKGPICIVPNGVDTELFSKEYPERVIEEIKDALGKRMGDVFLITTSRLVRKNAVDVCVRALSMLPEHVRFIVIGDGPLRRELEEEVRSLRLHDRVIFVGHIAHEELPKYLGASDIFIRPSRSEGMGNSFIEAFAAGLPVIATQEGGIADFLFDEKRNRDKPVTGFAVNKDSPEEIAAAVKSIMEHPEKTRAVVRTARALALERYDWNILAKDMRENVFGEVLQVR